MNSQLKFEAQEYNRTLNRYLYDFMYKYDVKLDINVKLNNSTIESRMIGIGADEFHSLKHPTYVGIQQLMVNNIHALNFTARVSYDDFQREIIDWLLWKKFAKQSCKLKRKKL